MNRQRPLVLVVDDDLALGSMIQRALEPIGYTVELAADATTGFARIERGDIDLVLLDCVLPDMNGLEWCQRVRGQMTSGYLPIIMITGLAGDAARHAGFVAGVDDYVTKPFAVQDLRDRVEAWMRTCRYLQAVRADQREELAQQKEVLAAALTTSHDLTRLMLLLTETLESRKMEASSPEVTAHLQAKFQDAANALAVRINVLLGQELGRPHSH
jgi:DNA-binding response OmpR family regulator